MGGLFSDFTFQISEFPALKCRSPETQIKKPGARNGKLGTRNCLLVHNEQLYTALRERPVAAGIITDLVGHSFLQNELPAVIKFGCHFTFDTINDMTFFAPMVSQVAGGVHHLPYTDVTKMQDFPCGEAGCSLMSFSGYLVPRSDGEWDIVIDMHGFVFFEVSLRRKPGQCCPL